ncbi:type II toxin-antitoxin system HipA family toxin [Aliidiomarina haloalkalitolerans]|uniref:Type II toxin-antitoxin system HipA family toxin n=1 Tax=Aliidiomarina haloalkalitolerans TaxID=859059 RepID=A0A432VX90_9GAMM|nr:HipA domain-containing protein [Aliidiomarina haloalkalitolerans]RUO21334.1 type II toxin-antitoxin system HipA family toxin [Aliidiomarina haloalkalitolerans]
MGICLGTLKPTADSQLTEGFSRRFVKSMFGLPSLPVGGLTIAMTASEFERQAGPYLEGQSISGVQRKVMVRLEGNKLVPAQGNGDYILKPTPPTISHLPENEHAMMNLARAVGLHAPDCAVIPFEDGEFGYITKRFDKLADGQRLFVEDAASLCQAHSSNKGDHDMWSYELAIRIMYEAAGRKAPVIMKGLQQVLFAYLVGNNDLHLKNFAMYRKPNSASTTMFDFTPMYDVLSVFPYPEYNLADYLTLSLNEAERAGTFSPEYEHFGYYTKQDFVALGQTLGLNEKAATAFVTVLTDKVEKHLKPIVQASLMPEPMQRVIMEEIENRIACLRRAL